MKFIDFFAGIGGFRRGMELEGHECVGFCEFDKFAVASYTSMHLITQEQREFLSKMPLKQRQKEIRRYLHLMELQKLLILVKVVGEGIM